MAEPDTTAAQSLDEGALIWGLIMGLLTGILVTLFKSPYTGLATRRKLAQNLREKIETAVVPPDPVNESLNEGKAAARRRLAELGRKSPD